MRIGERTPELALDYTFYLNVSFLALTAFFWWWRRPGEDASASDHGEGRDDEEEGSSGWSLDRVLTGIAWLAAGWIVLGAGWSLVR